MSQQTSASLRAQIPHLPPQEISRILPQIKHSTELLQVVLEEAHDHEDIVIACIEQTREAQLCVRGIRKATEMIGRRGAMGGYTLRVHNPHELHIWNGERRAKGLGMELGGDQKEEENIYFMSLKVQIFWAVAQWDTLPNLPTLDTHKTL